MELLKGTNSVMAAQHMGGGSLFWPAKPSGVKPYFTQWESVTTDVTGLHDGKTTFKLQHNIGTYIGKIRLRFTLGGLTAGATSVFNRRVDYVGFLVCKSIKLSYQGNLVLERKGPEMLDIYHNAYKEEFDRDNEAEYVHGQLSDAQREAEYGSDIDIVFDIPFPNAVASNAVWPSTTASELTLEVEWESLANIVENSAAEAVTPLVAADAIKNQQLDVQYIYMGENESMRLAQANLSQQGIIMPISDILRITRDAVTATGSSQELSIDLRELNHPLQALIFVVQKTSTLAAWARRAHERVGRGLGGNDDLTIETVKITGSNQDIKKAINLANLTRARWPKEHPSRPGGYTFEIPLSLKPQASTTSGGMEIDFTNYQSPQLVINFTGATGLAYTFKVYGITRNTLGWKQGNFRRHWH